MGCAGPERRWVDAGCYSMQGWLTLASGGQISHLPQFAPRFLKGTWWRLAGDFRDSYSSPAGSGAIQGRHCRLRELPHIHLDRLKRTRLDLGILGGNRWAPRGRTRMLLNTQSGAPLQWGLKCLRIPASWPLIQDLSSSLGLTLPEQILPLVMMEAAGSSGLWGSRWERSQPLREDYRTRKG